MPNPCSLFEIILNESNKGTQAPAVRSPGKETLTYGEISRHLKSITQQLSRQGFRYGHRLAIVLTNGPETATVFLAISSVCARVPLNPAYFFDEFLFSLSDLHIKALVILQGMGLRQPLADFSVSVDPDKPGKLISINSCPDKPSDWKMSCI
ncbi:MAG: AMP-binding protein [Anaerolineales bacterium]|jgi:acyl-CoA synthetase (AMP-forming)/AMP-acid ligase II